MIEKASLVKAENVDLPISGRIACLAVLFTYTPPPPGAAQTGLCMADDNQ